MACDDGSLLLKLSHGSACSVRTILQTECVANEEQVELPTFENVCLTFHVALNLCSRKKIAVPQTRLG